MGTQLEHDFFFDFFVEYVIVLLDNSRLPGPWPNILRTGFLCIGF